MKPIARTLQQLALLSLALLATAGHAQTADTYQVEAIVFAQPSAPISGNRMPEMQWADGAVMLDDTARSDVRRLDDTQRRLDREADRLKAQGYPLLMHSVWVQPADPDLKVAVHAGESLGDHYPVEAIIGLQRGQESMQIEVKAWRHSSVGAPGASTRQIVSEQLHQTRRLRLDEVHYLDHQSMGMLVRVTRR